MSTKVLTAAPVDNEPSTRGGARQWMIAHPIAGFVVLAYTISWTLWLLALVIGTDVWLSRVVFVAGAFGPPAAGAIMVKITGGSFATWARAIVHWRVPARYWLYAICLPAGLFAVANVILALLGEPVAWSLGTERVVPYLTTFVVTLFFLGAQEEPGWRGYALPRLQQRFTPFKATVILGLVWGLWHLPVAGPAGAIVPFVLAFFYTWLYNRTGSVLLAILLHASFTPAQDHLILIGSATHGATDAAIGVVYLVGVAALLFLTRGRLGFDAVANARRIDAS